MAPDIAQHHETIFDRHLNMQVLDMQFEKVKWRNMQGAIHANYGYQEELDQAETFLRNYQEHDNTFIEDVDHLKLGSMMQSPQRGSHMSTRLMSAQHSKEPYLTYSGNTGTYTPNMSFLNTP